MVGGGKRQSLKTIVFQSGKLGFPRRALLAEPGRCDPPAAARIKMVVGQQIEQLGLDDAGRHTPWCRNWRKRQTTRTPGCEKASLAAPFHHIRLVLSIEGRLARWHESRVRSRRPGDAGHGGLPAPSVLG